MYLKLNPQHAATVIWGFINFSTVLNKNNNIVTTI